MNNIITFNGKVIGRTNDQYTPEELDAMSRAGITVYTAIGSNYIDLLTGNKLVAVA